MICSRRWISIPARLYCRGTDLGLRVSKDRERFPVVISTASVAELARLHEGPNGLTLVAQSPIPKPCPHSTGTFHRFAGTGAPDRFAADPQSGHLRR